jgi:hypothetical protein
LDATASRDMHMTLPKHLPTLKVHSTGNYTCTDNVFMTTSLLDAIMKCQTVPEDQPARSDHFPVDTTLEVGLTAVQDPPKHNYRKVDWEQYNKLLQEKLERYATEDMPMMREDFHRNLEGITRAITETTEELVPKMNPSPAQSGGGLWN